MNIRAHALGSQTSKLPCVGLRLLSALIVWTTFAAVLRAQKPEPQSAESSSQLWYGKMVTPGRHFRFALEFTPSGKDTSPQNWTGKLTSLDEGNAEFSLANIKNDGSEFAFSLEQTKATYSGNLAEGIVSGTWSQRGNELELQFKQVDAIPREKLRAVWLGTINLIIQKLDLQVRELESGVIYLDSITQKVGGFVATKTIDGSNIKFDVAALKATFEGQMNDDGTEIAGTWKQGFVSPSLTLRKQAEEQIITPQKPTRPQTPKPPFPYDVVEVTFENENENVTLAGTVTVPKNASQPVPGVVLVSGSGPQDRDETIAGHKPFWVIADYFSRNGIAVLRYDDRGTASSTGDFAEATSEDLASDANAAATFLQNYDGVDPKQVGIAGHSEGGLIAPMVAVANKSIPFIVLMAGPGVNGEKILVSQSALILRASGMSKEEIASESKAQKALLALVKTRPRLSDAEFKAQATLVLQAAMGDAATNQELEAAVASTTAQLRSPWLEYFMVHEPGEDLRKLTCAVLAINGEKDLQVEPQLNLEAIRQALQAAPTQDFQTVELEDLNHLFQKAQTGLMSEYGEIQETFHEPTLRLMTDWILEHTR